LGRADDKIGGDVNFDVTPTLKLNPSPVNTDFAQVESGQGTNNLASSHLLPEKRH